MNKFFLFLLTAAIAAAALNVPFDVSNWCDVARDSEAVTAGIPLPIGAVNDLAKLRITDGSGNTVPAQFRALSKWWVEKNTGKTANPSTKWVLMDFQASVAASNKTSFSLRDDYTGSALTTALSVVDAVDRVTVTTGPLKFTVSKQHFNLFDEAWLDANHNGLYDASEKIVASNLANGGVITAGGWTAGGCVDGQEHTASQNAPESVRILEQGPMKVVIQIDGRHYAATGGVTKGLYGYQVFITAYAGRPYVDIQYALTNTYMEGDKPQIGATPYKVYAWPFKKYLVNLNLNLGGSQSYTHLGETEVTGSLTASPVRLMQDSGAYTITGSAGGVNAKGGVAVSNGTLGVRMALRDFGPNYPKAISVQQDKMVLELLPDKGVNYSLDPLSRKNQRIRVEFFSGAIGSGNLLSLWKKTDAPLRALASDPNWYRDTRAWDDGFAPPPGYSRFAPGSWQRMAKPPYGGAQEYAYNSGWNRYGYIPDFNGGGDHWNLSSCYGVYLVTGNPTDFEYSEHRTFYFNDMVQVHTSENRMSTLDYLLNFEKHITEVTFGDPSVGFYRALVDSFAGCKWNRHTYDGTPNIPDYGHMPNQQVLEYYLLTGDPPTYCSMLDQGVRAAAGILYMTYFYYGGWKFDDHHGAMVDLDHYCYIMYGTRYNARPMQVALQAYEATGDSIFLYPAKIEAYDLRNFTRRSPVGFISDIGDTINANNAYGRPWFLVWAANHPGVATPNSAITALFQNAIGLRALYKYWEVTGDEEVRDPVIFAAKNHEWVAAKTGNTYTGFQYTWADYWSDGARGNPDSSSFTGSNGEAFAGLCYGYLASGRSDLFKVISDAIPIHGSSFTDRRMFCFYQSLWRSTLDTVPPAAVTDLAVTPTGPGAVHMSWTAPGDNGNTGTVAEYQVKYWPANAPIVDFVKRWDAGTQTGWPDLRDSLPYTVAAWLNKAAQYKNEQEVSFWAALNAKNEPAPQAAGAAVTFDLTGLVDDGTYRFAMVSFDSIGNVSGLSNVVSAVVDGTAIEKAERKQACRLALYSNAPNPFNPSTVISYSVPGMAGVGNAWIKLEVVNIQGQRVKTLVNGMKTAGSQSVCWNGTDDVGKHVGSGIYFYRLTSEKKVLQKQAILLK
ncbi:MAG: FlgD immunoglobulin-like domain containing protein [Fibrobacterota bacterium]